ncbi:hypothetical protein AB6A40_010870 [Gnathostoma spinigerum]|uniref:Transposase n=1 Tax=Gnathostoma spinigerum TaxID=75299 RepID=A0ABD6F1Z9_9BILA
MRRARELSSDICMKEFKWQSGGEDTVEQDGQDTRSYSPPFAVWNEHLPTDTQLVWSWFCVYMDNRMSVNSLASDLNAPFTSVYFLKKPNKPTTIQNAKDSFYLFESSVNPPHFEFVVNGGRERFDVGRGPKNFWRALLLFIQHIRLFCNKHIDHLSIDETGINLSCVLD